MKMRGLYWNSARPVPSRHQDKYPPKDSDGVPDGSYYVDVTNNHADLYGPKKDGKWPQSSVSLIGREAEEAERLYSQAKSQGHLTLTKFEE